MRKTLLFVFTLLIAAVPVFGGCNDYPFYEVIGPGYQYEYVYSDSCLDHTLAVTWTTSAPTCVGTTNAWQFTQVKGTVSKTYSVPSGYHQTHWTLSYLLDKNDPIADPFTALLRVTLRNASTGTKLAEQTIWSDDPDVSCAYRSLTYTGDLAGASVKIEFQGQTTSSSTTVRIRSISLIQAP